MKIINTLIIMLITTLMVNAQPVGIFDGSSDIGKVKYVGSAQYNKATDLYNVKASGKNLWGTADEFHFVWKKIEGDFILYTRLAFLGNGVDPHRKAGVMLRQSLDTNTVHVNAVVHGDGLTSLQYRKIIGGETLELKAIQSFYNIVQIQKIGNVITMKAAHEGEPLEIIASLEMTDFSKDFYVGIFACSHNPDVVEEAVFSNVRLSLPAPANFVPYQDYLGSRLEVMDIATASRKVIYESAQPFEAPNWTLDDKFFIYNSKGLIYKLPVEGGKPEQIPTGTAIKNNNDHVISFDGKWLGISSSPEGKASMVHVVPITGGEARLVTDKYPSYFHGWSPDGKTLIYTAQRNEVYDIYSISVNGGKETQLTNARGLDDGSEYSPDGKYIYFNSTRTGTMQIWRMKPDGSQQEQITFDQYNDWFPHISPDGKWIVFISYPADVLATDHPYYKHVMLRIMPASGGAPRVLAHLYGGQGSFNVPSWSPDSKRIAFVSNSIIK